MADITLKITDANFEEKVIKSKKPVLVDFWASWCHPCIVMGPTVEEVAKKVGTKIIVGKLNVDENPKTAERFDVMSIPTFILFENGEPQKTTVGSMDKSKLIDSFRKWME